MPIGFLKRSGALLGLGQPQEDLPAKPAARSPTRAGKPSGPAQSSKPGSKSGGAYRSVSVVTGPVCCQTAKQLKGRRFIAQEMPPLPLPGCDRPKCSCRYQHHEDRRDDPRRLEDMGIAIDGWVATERRAGRKRGRRSNDGG